MCEILDFDGMNELKWVKIWRVWATLSVLEAPRKDWQRRQRVRYRSSVFELNNLCALRSGAQLLRPQFSFFVL